MFKRSMMLGLSLLVVAGVAPASQAEPTDKAIGLVKQFAHSNSKEFVAAQQGAGGHTLKPAKLANGKAARGWLAVDGESFGLTAELPAGTDQVVFDELVPEGFSMVVRSDGSAEVRDRDGQKTSDINRPWARDAKGVSLKTRYEARGTTLVQHVDTSNATFPVVADPWVTNGWWYTTSVAYVELSWSETWKLKNGLDANGVDSLGMICGVVPLPGKPTCKYVLSYVLPDVRRYGECRNCSQEVLQGESSHDVRNSRPSGLRLLLQVVHSVARRISSFEGLSSG